MCHGYGAQYHHEQLVSISSSMKKEDVSIQSSYTSSKLKSLA